MTYLRNEDFASPAPKIKIFDNKKRFLAPTFNLPNISQKAP